MNIHQATDVVRRDQNAYLRGELDEETVSWLNEAYPQAIPDWDKMKLNMKVKRKKIRGRVKNVLLGGANKSMGCRRFRPGKQKSTLKNQTKLLTKAKKDFYAAGLPVLLTWADFMDEIGVSLGIGSSWK